MRIAVGLLLIVLGVAGALAFVPVNSPGEITIELTVTRESLATAKASCERTRRTMGGYAGYAAMYTQFGEYVSAPCRLVKEANQ